MDKPPMKIDEILNDVVFMCFGLERLHEYKLKATTFCTHAGITLFLKRKQCIGSDFLCCSYCMNMCGWGCI